METRGEQMLALRRRRMAAAPAFFRGGFRPFFFGGPAWALIALTLWLLTLAGTFELPSAFEPLAWHRHEMLFGFVGAVVAGFLLTAIPNWTGRLPIAGMPLAALFGLWVTARIAVLFSATLGLAFAALLDVGFYILLAGLAAREVLASNNRNVPIVGLVLLFGLANTLDYAEAAGLIDDAGLASRAGIALVVLMISLIGGRIVPSFTRNWLAKQGVKQGLPGQPSRYDVVTIIATAAALLGWTAFPFSWGTGGLLIIAAALQAARLARWKGYRTLSDALVLILHVGYAWVPVGLALLGASILGAAFPSSAAVHALTAGAMATMILAVMTRATLGHTGRDLKAGPATAILYLFITIGAVLRVIAPIGLVPYKFGMEFAAVAWAGAFFIFLVAYGPMLFRARPDGGS
jgi:uncharacterized protein involved in response to NO